MESVKEKKEKLIKLLREMAPVAVAFSGGTDSSFLLAVAADCLGREKVIALSMESGFCMEDETKEAAEFCCALGVERHLVQVNMEDIPHFTENPPDRCYHCKRFIFTELQKMASTLSNGSFTLVEGTNVDDTGDYRPGLQALRELGVLSPLLEAGLTKAEIRMLSKEMNLPTWNKPSAACLASRIPYEETITKEALRRVDAAEHFLRNLGFTSVRVRVHGGTLARIEVDPADIPRLATLSQEVTEVLRSLGFRHITLDLAGYQMGGAFIRTAGYSRAHAPWDNNSFDNMEDKPWKEATKN